ncbi:hypothetical protein [Sulfurimonas sp.]
MKFIIFFFLLVNLNASIKQKMFQLYQNEQYSKACIMGSKYFKKYKKDENYVSLYAFSCVKSDYIDRLALPITTLRFSKETRKNSIYFATILMQKKLLYYSLVDGYNLSKYRFPSTDYVLSKVFDLYSKLGTHKKRDFYILKDPNDEKLIYKLFLIKKRNVKKMVIEEYYDTIKIKRHIYW